MDTFLELQAEFFEQANRDLVVGSRYANNPLQTEHVSPVIHHRFRTFKGVTVSAKAFEKGEPNINPLQRFSFHQTAHPNGRSIRFEFDAVKTEAEPGITRQNFLYKICCCIIRCPQAAVANETVKIWFVHQFEHESRILRR